MQISMAHLRERSTSGGWIDFAVFDAKSTSGTNADNQALLEDLTARARAAGLKVDQAALAFRQGGRQRFFGSKNLVDHLSRNGFPRWTHKIAPQPLEREHPLREQPGRQCSRAHNNPMV